MRTFIKLLLFAFLLSFNNECIAAGGKNIWQQKRERYEKAQKEAVQKGETFDPNEYERQEELRREENSMSALTVVGILVGIVAVGGVITVVFSKIQETKDKGNGIVIIVILVAILACVVWFLQLKSCSEGNYVPGDEDTEWQYKHTDRHY